MGIWVAPALVFALIPLWDRTWKRRGWVIGAAVVGVSLIKAISPLNHLYYEIPQAAALAVALASLGGLILQSPSRPRPGWSSSGSFSCSPRDGTPIWSPISSDSADFGDDYYGSADALSHFVSGHPLTQIPPGFHDRPLYSWKEIHEHRRLPKGSHDAHHTHREPTLQQSHRRHDSRFRGHRQWRSTTRSSPSFPTR